MPPKPFKPPRPSAESAPTSKSNTKKTSASTKKSIATTSNPNRVTKSKAKPRKKQVNENGNGNGEKGNRKSTGSVKAANRQSFATLHSLSPDSGDEDVEADEDEDARAGERRNRKPRRQTQDQDEDEADLSQSNNSDEEEDEEDQPSPALPRRKLPRPNRQSPSPPPSFPSINKPAIPHDLLNVLLHQHYKHPSTRMTKAANAAVGRYMETFVREALARVAYAKGGGERGVQAGGEMLEVEDLERVGVGLMLDF